MKKNKGTRILVTLECTNCRLNTSISKGIFRYITKKNRRNTPNRLELNKYCPSCNKHNLYKEIK